MIATRKTIDVIAIVFRNRDISTPYLFVKNLLGHDITISGYGTLTKCDNPCYVETKQRIIGKVANIPIAETQFDKIVNLPDPEEGVYYIVSRVSMEFIPFDREDVFCVDTGNASGPGPHKWVHNYISHISP